MAGAIVFSLSVGIALVVDISLRNHTKLLEIVTDDEQCTQLVRHLLETTDSNAVDGAVAGMLCLSITRPDQTSLMGYNKFPFLRIYSEIDISIASL